MTRNRKVAGCCGIKGEKGAGGRQQDSGVDLQEPGNVALLCNHAAWAEHTGSVSAMGTYFSFSASFYLLTL